MELKRISEDDLVCLLHLEEENLHLFFSPETGASYLTLTSISLTVQDSSNHNLHTSCSIEAHCFSSSLLRTRKTDYTFFIKANSFLLVHIS